MKSKKIPKFNIWQGVYKNFKGLGTDSLAHQSWVTNSVKKLTTPSNKDLSINNTLALLVGTMNNKQKIKILDFGGGLGLDYLRLNGGLHQKTKLEYHIVETSILCKEGQKRFKKMNKELFFHENFPKIKNVDIVHIKSSLQYMEDWEGTLKALAHYKPKYFLFQDLTAGLQPQYASLQQYYHLKIPVWFFNLPKIVKKMQTLGYTLIHQEIYANFFLGKLEIKCPQDNFPQKMRIGSSKTLLFKK